MTLGKGNHLIKVGDEPDRNAGTFADRIRKWVDTHPEGEITERELAQILCPNESYVIHEVAEDVNYQMGRYQNARGASISHVDATLKVVH